MKKILFIVFLFVSLIANAQKDVTKFLGIPVDGTKTAMRQKLIAKGFTYDQKNDLLKGEFNGEDVRISIVTNNNKVYRIVIYDNINRDETNIKIRFNKLVRQFMNNNKYISAYDFSIPENEKIGYEMAINKKTYEALFLQTPIMQKEDTLALRESMRHEMLKKYTEEQLSNPNDEILQEWDKVAQNITLEYFSKKAVWFRIEGNIGDYFIVMYYDNEYNKANGEDL